MKISIVGGNSAAHFIAQRLLEDDRVEKVYHWSANPACVPTDRYHPVAGRDFKTVDVASVPVDLIVPTVLQFQVNQQFQAAIAAKSQTAFMPAAQWAMLEWSKISGKKLIEKLGLPSPRYRWFRKDSLLAAFKALPRPFVLKFERDWRAGLQTIIVTDDNYLDEYDKLVKEGSTRLMKKYFGDFRDQSFLVEDFVAGHREYSLHALFNATGWTYLGAARDYKRFSDGDTGFNTASMGCYSPSPDVDLDQVSVYLDRFYQHFMSQGQPYVGVLYLGIMVDETGRHQILEINTRFGDPEIQTIIATLGDDTRLLDLLQATATNQPLPKVTHSDRAAVSVRLVHRDYRDVVKDSLVEGRAVDINPALWPEDPNIYLSYNADRFLLNTTLTTTADTIQEASDRIYGFLANKELYDYTHRSDIGRLP